MKKVLVLLTVFFAVTVLGFTQNNVNDIRQTDQVMRSLAISIHAKLLEKKVEKVTVGQFSYQNYMSLFGAYLENQLTSELTNMPRRNYTVLSGAPPSDNSLWVITGEIIITSDVVRLYSRLIRIQDRSVEASFTSDFTRNAYILNMFSSSSSSSSGSSSFVMDDAMEPDSRESPVRYEIGTSVSDAVIMNRTLTRSDEDYFLLVPQGSGRLTAETTGNVDTIMELYNYASGQRLASNDDGGQENNARIVINAAEGTQYLAVVKGCSSSDTGSYGFRSYIAIRETINKDDYEDDDEYYRAKVLEIDSSQRHNFHHENDVDWVKFEIRQSGRYIISAKGVNNNSLDTYFELYNDEMDEIGNDDDGGDGFSSRLSINLREGTYFLKILCLDEDPTQAYELFITPAR